MTAWMDVEQARGLPGLRLVLTAGVPGPWGEAAKGVFRVKGIDFARVRQLAGQPNEALHAWTGHRNAPIAMYADERPRTGWLEILHLAERLAPEPALLPAEPEERALMLGLSTELMGEGGLGWCRRLMLFEQSPGGGAEAPAPNRAALARMLDQYDYSREAARRAPARLAGILGLFATRLRARRQAGERYVMGARLLAVDLHLAAMLGIVAPLSEADCPTPAGMRAIYGARHPVVDAALDPILLEHRDLVYREHMGLPVEL